VSSLPPHHCFRRRDCRPGDWVEADSLGEWKEPRPLQYFVNPEGILHKKPLKLWIFRKEARPGEKGVPVAAWVRIK
jgi:hypothetical protein